MIDTLFANTPEPPYYAVIFTSLRTNREEGYTQMDQRMFELAQQQPGFLGSESVQQNQRGITVSYWQDEASILRWKQHSEHLQAQKLGKQWYDNYSVRICRVERAYWQDI